MKPLAILGALLVAMVAATVLLLSAREPGITLTDALLVPVKDGYALTLTIENPGPPDRLVEVSAEDGQVMVAGALFSGGLAIPSEGTPKLATDGAYGFVTGLSDESEGRLVPVTLRFEGAGTATTRARVARPAGHSDHDTRYEVPPEEPQPRLSMTVTPQEDGYRVTLDTENFAFDREAVDGPHVPGTGHGHLYLDGLKLTRVYGPEQLVGALPPGEYEIGVALNTNDHRAYVVEGLPVADSVRLTVD